MNPDQVLNTDSQQTTNFTHEKLAVWNPRTAQGDYNNSTYDDVVLKQGTLMGRIAATKKIVPLDSNAADGSQFPLGILLNTRTIEAGEEKSLALVVSGDIDESLIILADGDTLDTVIDGRTIRDRIGADTVGLKLINPDELGAFDNQ